MQTEKVFIGDTEIDLDTQIELAEHGLIVAINHLNDLLAQREAHLEAQAENHANAQLGEAYAEELNANPFRFIGGGK